MKRLLTAAFAALALLAAPVMAQDAPPTYIWISFYKAKAGQGDALIKTMIQDDGKILDGLVDDGGAYEWGIGMPIVHDGGDPYSHVEWVTFRGWQGADDFMARFMKMRDKLSPEEAKAMGQRWAALVEPGSHADLIVRNVHVGKGMGGKPRYIQLGYYQPKPGKYRALREDYKNYVVPVYDKLVADGVVDNYGLAVPEVHRGQGWSFMSWALTDNLAARDTIDKAFDAADAAMTDEQRQARRQRYMEDSDFSAHRDQILLVVHLKRPQAK